MSSTSQLKAGLQGNGRSEARRTRQQLQELKKKGSLLGYFGKVTRGRPPKAALSAKNDAASNSTQATKKRKDAPSNTTESTQKKTRTYWKSEKNFPLMRDAVLSAINGTNLTTSTAEAAVAIPYSTLKDHINYFHDAASKWKVPVESVTATMVLGLESKKSLLSDDDIAFLVDCIRTRDHANNGMSRHESIRLIQELAQCSDFKKFENHYDYLIRSKKLVGR